jgi:hypothetical protein
MGMGSRRKEEGGRRKEERGRRREGWPSVDFKSNGFSLAIRHIQ